MEARSESMNAAGESLDDRVVRVRVRKGSLNALAVVGVKTHGYEIDTDGAPQSSLVGSVLWRIEVQLARR